MRICTIRNMADTVRGRRTDLKLSQAELARRTRVSRKWINEFEAGKATAEFGLMLRVLEALGLVIWVAEEETAPPRGVPRVDLDALLDEYRNR